VSVDLFYERAERTREHDAIAVEMEAAALFALGATLRVAVGCMLCVSDTFAEDGERRRIDVDTMRESVERMGAHALAALRC
jgi:nucleoside phosphorylase